MKKRVTVVVPDGAICVDGEWLFFDFTAPENIRVIQWYQDGYQHIEHMDKTSNAKITSYQKQVEPFVMLFEAEKARRAALLDTQPTEEVS